MIRCNDLACAKPKNRYIQQQEGRSRAEAVDRKCQTKIYWNILYVHA